MKTGPIAVFAAVTLLSWVVPASAGPVEDGHTAYEAGDYAAAQRYWTQAADQGDRDAQNSLGKMHLFGDGVPRSYAEAAKWFQLAAEQGQVEAQNTLGILYEDGDGVLQDYVEAARWYSLAAEQGDGYAQFNLGEMYMKGWGVPQDNVRAHMFFNLAFSRTQHARHGRFRDEIAARMTTDEIAEAQKLAREWIDTHSKP